MLCNKAVDFVDDLICQATSMLWQDSLALYILHP